MNGVANWSFGHIAIAIIVAIAIVGIVYIFVKQSGVPIPSWVWQVLWIIVLAVVCILAVKLLIAL